ncbi:hypothetical protein CKO22_17665 [Thiococcus pfennigii]|nr:hypothetical protein [Thiococcus pfennigii]
MKSHRVERSIAAAFADGEAAKANRIPISRRQFQAHGAHERGDRAHRRVIFSRLFRQGKRISHCL